MKIPNLRYNRGAIYPVIMLLLFSIAFLAGCHKRLDPILSDADAKIDVHPDSALMILQSYTLPATSSEYERAYYGLLLTHARYKNFIDETDDSLINASSVYFLEHDDKEFASRALFLQGMIQMNANHLGEAAVSFRNGLDIAQEGKHYMWEGQCARGLFAVACRLKNGSEQIEYAKAEYEAFLKGNYEDWSKHAKLNILRAYNNNGQYQKALEGAKQLLKEAESERDTMLTEEILPLMGTCYYALGEYKMSLTAYLNAYKLNPSIIDENDRFIISKAASSIDQMSVSDSLRKFVDYIMEGKESIPDFCVMAQQGQYEEAYKSLERYRAVQDSVLKVIMQNNVSETMNQYDEMQNAIRNEQVKNERLTWCLVVLLLGGVFGFTTLQYKKRLYVKDMERRHMETSIDSLRSDLSMQVAKVSEILESNRIISEKNEMYTSYLRDALQNKYAEINELCDSYFQDRIKTSRKKVLSKDIEKIIKDFKDEEFLKTIGLHIDKYFDGLFTSFIIDFPNANIDMKRLFMYLSLGFSSRTICVFFDIELTNLYNRKSRLKRIVSDSNSDRKEEYLKNIQ